MGELTYGENMSERLSKAKPYLLMISLQFGSAGMYVFSKLAVDKGMSHFVFIVYRNATAAITLAPFAIVLERKVRPKMTLRIFSEILALGFIEIILDQCFTLLGMKLTSASFTSAVMNVVPSITFLMAILLRLETMDIKRLGCIAKVIGTAVTFGGAVLMALYKGPLVNIIGSAARHSGQPENVNDPTGAHWILGVFFVFVGCVAFAAFYIMQAITLRKYPAEMSLAAWICFMGSLQSFAVALYAEHHHPQVWSLGWDSRLFAPAYSGIIGSGVQFYVQGLVMKTMGPVFVTAFNPLRMIIVMAIASFVLSEQLHLGSIIGAAVVAVGLYLVVWGKSKEKKSMMPPSPTKGSALELPVTAPAAATDRTNINKVELATNGDKNSDLEARRSESETETQ